MDSIEDVVRRLTAPSFEHVFQKLPNGDGRSVTVELPPLLVQMRDRVFPSGEANGGGALKSTRSLGDFAAMEPYAKIAAQVGDWCRMARIRDVPRDTVEALLAWHDRTRGRLGPYEAWFRGELTGWLLLILDTVDGPKKRVLRVACPVCGGTSWGDQINGGDLWPIQVRWREDGPDEDWVARCRIPVKQDGQPCGTVWRGLDAIRELGEEIAEKETA